MAKNPNSKKSKNKKPKSGAPQKSEGLSEGDAQRMDEKSKSTILTAALFGAVTAITLATYSSTYAGVP